MTTTNCIPRAVVLNCNEAQGIYNSSSKSGQTKFSISEAEDYKKKLIVL